MAVSVIAIFSRSSSSAGSALLPHPGGELPDRVGRARVRDHLGVPRIAGISVAPTLTFRSTTLGGQPVWALARGWASECEFSWRHKISVSAMWPWLSYGLSRVLRRTWAARSRRPVRTQVNGIIGALAWAGVWDMAATWAMLHLFGNAFWANLGNAEPGRSPDSRRPRPTAKCPGTPSKARLSHSWCVFGLHALVRTSGSRRTPCWSRRPCWRGGSTELVPRPGSRRADKRYLQQVNALIVIFGLGIVTSAPVPRLPGSCRYSTAGTVGITASMIVVAIAASSSLWGNTGAWRGSPATSRALGIRWRRYVGLVSLPSARADREGAA